MTMGNGKVIMVNAFIMEELALGMILGMDMLHKLGAKIDCGKGEMTFGNDRRPIRVIGELASPNRKYDRGLESVGVKRRTS